MPKLKISPPPFPNRKEYPFTASVRYRGMVIDVENLSGSVREGTDPNGKKWKTAFTGCHYGELRGSLGSDGDPLDIYIKSRPNDGANKAYVVHQNFPRTHPTKAGKYDEDKVILGVSSLKEARELYLKHYNRKDFLRSITEMPVEKFKRAAMGENKGEKVAWSLEPDPGPADPSRIGTLAWFEHMRASGALDDKDLLGRALAASHLLEGIDGTGKKRPPHASIQTKMREEGTPMNIEAIKAAACATPGEKIRSKGKGRGLGTGDGSGPRGAPIGAKGTADDEDTDESVCETPGEKIRSGGKGQGRGTGRGRGPQGIPIGEKKSEVTEAYKLGAQTAMEEYLKVAAQKGFQSVLKKLPGSPPVMGAIPAPPKVTAIAGKVSIASLLRKISQGTTTPIASAATHPVQRQDPVPKALPRKALLGGGGGVGPLPTRGSDVMTSQPINQDSAGGYSPKHI